MPQLRRDPLFGCEVLIAENRALRPNALHVAAEVHHPTVAVPGECPFCEGQESQTPSELFAVRPAESRPNEPGWRIRVIPNKYPAVGNPGASSPTQFAEPLPEPPEEAAGTEDSDSLTVNSVAGIHEVIVESPRHVTVASALGAGGLREVLSVYRHRLSVHRLDSSLRYGVVFKNVGRAAGASLEHLHSQLIALPFVPSAAAREFNNFGRLSATLGECPLCYQIQREQRLPERLVRESQRFLAYCPYASRVPYEVRIVPTACQPNFESIDEAECEELADLMAGIFCQIERLSPLAAYNCAIYTSPFDSSAIEHYHWRMEIIPRLTAQAGFEWSTDCFINPVSPESAARRLREMIASWK